MPLLLILKQDIYNNYQIIHKESVKIENEFFPIILYSNIDPTIGVHLHYKHINNKKSNYIFYCFQEKEKEIFIIENDRRQFISTVLKGKYNQ